MHAMVLINIFEVRRVGFLVLSVMRGAWLSRQCCMSGYEREIW